MKTKYLLITILLVAAVLRIWNLGTGDPMGDEVLYGFRAIGMLDFDNAEFQTTPLEWQDPNIQWWTALSFHDHPPLVFLIQNLSISVFGENPFAFRFPSVLMGIFSVFLVYLIGRRLFGEQTGLLSAAMMAITANAVFISRVGLQEAYVIFFVLLVLYGFLRGLEEERYFLLAGAAVGFGLITKYTSLAITPALLIYLVFFQRSVFRKKYFWFGAVLAMAIFSPVIIYNIMLYRAVGHFDFQISYVLGQNPAVWQSAPGKEEIGGLGDRLKSFIPNLISSNSWLFLAVFAVSSILTFRKSKLLFSLFTFYFLFLLLIGPTLRFLSILTPFMALSIGYGYSLIRTNRRITDNIVTSILITTVAFEIFYSLNSQVSAYPVGKAPWLYSELISWETYRWGYSELGQFLNQELIGKMPAFTLTPKYKFLEELQEISLEQSRRVGKERYPAIIVYDANIFGAAQLWFLDRLQIYHGWPVLKTEEYLEILRTQGNDYFKKVGAIIYFIKPSAVQLKDVQKRTMVGGEFEQQLLAEKIFPQSIYNKKREEAFRIYAF